MKTLLSIIFSIVVLASCHQKGEYISPDHGPSLDTITVNVKYEVIRVTPVSSSGGTCINDQCLVGGSYYDHAQANDLIGVRQTFSDSPSSLPAGNQIVFTYNLTAKSGQYVYIKGTSPHYNLKVNLYINGSLYKSVNTGTSTALNTKAEISHKVLFAY